MKRPILVLCCCLCAAAVADDVLTAPVTVANVTCRQVLRTRKLVVDYDLMSDGQPAFVRLDVLTNGVSIGADKFRSLSGDVSRQPGEVVEPGVGKRLTWDPGADWRGNVLEDAEVVVRAYYTNDLHNAQGVYMVVDLSGGHSAESYPVGYTFTPPDLMDVTNATRRLWLRRVEPGTFMMGSPTNELGRGGNETRHKVTLTRAFFASICPVTREQYRQVLGSVPSGQGGLTDMCPVNKVSYHTIRGTTTDWPQSSEVAEGSFLGLLRAKTGFVGFDLPTEAQWEYTCRAGTATALNNGCNITNETSDANVMAVAWCRPESSANFVVSAVGQKQPNAWGFYDMHGNIYEPCLDWYGGDYSTMPATDPIGPASGTTIIYRGGALGCGPKDVRSAVRRTDKDKDVVDVGYGFRVFCTIW